MKVRKGDKMICLNATEILSGYYDSKYEPGMVLTVLGKYPKVQHIRGSLKFVKFKADGITPKGHAKEFSCSREQVNTSNFQKQKP